jgi:hypothetical protein
MSSTNTDLVAKLREFIDAIEQCPVEVNVTIDAFRLDDDGMVAFSKCFPDYDFSYREFGGSQWYECTTLRRHRLRIIGYLEDSELEESR